MDIDLSLLHSRTTNEIKVEGNYLIPKEYYENSDVIDIENINIEGVITYDNEEDHMKCNITGNIISLDSISLEEVKYPINIKYDDKIEDNCKKSENILDILEFLWENIVLEIPLQFTRVEDLSKFHGDGWRLINEDELKSSNNPFIDLMNDYDKE